MKFDEIIKSYEKVMTLVLDNLKQVVVYNKKLTTLVDTITEHTKFKYHNMTTKAYRNVYELIANLDTVLKQGGETLTPITSMSELKAFHKKVQVFQQSIDMVEYRASVMMTYIVNLASDVKRIGLFVVHKEREIVSLAAEIRNRVMGAHMHANSNLSFIESCILEEEKMNNSTPQ